MGRGVNGFGANGRHELGLGLEVALRDAEVAVLAQKGEMPLQDDLAFEALISIETF